MCARLRRNKGPCMYSTQCAGGMYKNGARRERYINIYFPSPPQTHRPGRLGALKQTQHVRSRRDLILGELTHENPVTLVKEGQTIAKIAAKEEGEMRLLPWDPPRAYACAPGFHESAGAASCVCP